MTEKEQQQQGFLQGVPPSGSDLSGVRYAPSADDGGTASRPPSSSRARTPVEKKLLSIAREWRRGTVSTAPFKGSDGSLLCFVICDPLTAYLQFLGYECRPVQGTVFLDEANEIWGHYWIELPDGRILDPTASQFNGKGKPKMPAVYLGKRPSYYHPPASSASAQGIAVESPQAEGRGLGTESPVREADAPPSPIND